MKKYIDFFKFSTSFDFDLYDVLCALVYARSVKPCSKYKTFHEVIPYLYQDYDFSYDQLLSALEYYRTVFCPGEGKVSDRYIDHLF